MRFLVDAQLPPALARWITQQGHDAEHVGDRAMATAPDGEIWNYALAAPAIIITKDEDFPRRRAVSTTGPTIIWIRLPNTRRRELIAWFETVFPKILAELDHGETLIEIA
jgi:predicted nuclease of predicted toxin-antitoxin system